jgi:hypothetical protein
MPNHCFANLPATPFGSADCRKILRPANESLHARD